MQKAACVLFVKNHKCLKGQTSASGMSNVHHCGDVYKKSEG